jgi:hypothetical protein
LGERGETDSRLPLPHVRLICPQAPTPLLTERSIINFLIWTGGLILGPYLAVSTVEFNFIPIGLFAGVCGVALIFGAMRDRMCLLPLIGLFIAGKFNFIPVLHPAPSEFCPVAALAYYLIAYVALQRKKVLSGPLYFFIPIVMFALIILYHEHNFGLRSLGNGREGGRGAVFMLVAAVTYVCCVSISSPSPRFLAWTPIFCMVVASISALPYTITTYFPGASPYFFIVTDNINASAYAESAIGQTDVVRNQAQAGIGAAVMTVLLAYFPIYSWWRPHRWWVAIVALICIALVVMGGFRSALAGFGLTILVGASCYMGWRALFLLVPVVAGIFLATALQDSHAIRLPEAAQRSLSFLPGDWDPAVVASTDSSNEFRQKILHVYMTEDARKSPLLGNGISYDAADFERYNYLAKYHETPDGYYSTKIFVTGKIFHTGWISLYDAVGVIGFALFLFLGLSLVWVTGRMVFRKGVDHHSPLFPLKVWMFCNIFPGLVSYFTVFGDIKSQFPALCYYAILWAHLDRIERDGYRPAAPVREVSFDSARTEMSHAV